MPSELEAFRGTALLVIIMKAGMLSGINIELSSTLLIWIGLRDRLGTSIDISLNPRISIHASISISYAADHVLELSVHVSGRGYPQPFPWTDCFLVYVVSRRQYRSKG
jgi:hypothetical protein